jgi:hypothetical protein
VVSEEVKAVESEVEIQPDVISQEVIETTTEK